MIPKPDNPESAAEMKVWADYNRDLISPDEEAIEPMSVLYYPIIDGLDLVNSIEGEGDGDKSNRTVAGMLAGLMYWRALVKGILRPGSNGIVAVFTNPCTDSFTYQIMGPNATYLGVGDKHDMRYDNLGIHSKLIELQSFSIDGSSYTGIPFDEEFCSITLHLYPSDEMKSDYTTGNPINSTVAVVAIFAFASVAFCFYVYRMERRRQLVLRSAETHSTTIVSSQNPDNAKERLHSFHRDDKAEENATAEMYPDTTVLIADIAGFDSWSSSRQPTQVFHLLETLYGAFDEIAKKRGVSKVETIGDSYVTVVGLPTPRKQHAVVMAKFAKDCRDKMIELTLELEKTLGPVR